MKVLVPILFLLVYSISFSQWQQEGNVERFFVDSAGFSDFSLSADGKYLHTLHKTKVVNTWDMQTGEQMSKPWDSFSQGIKKGDSVLLSSDGNTILVINNDMAQYANVVIFDILSLKPIDSAVIKFAKNSSGLIYFGLPFLDYYSSKRSLVSAIEYDSYSSGNRSLTTSSGCISWFIKQDTKWKNVYEFYTNPNFVTFNPETGSLLYTGYFKELSVIYQGGKEHRNEFYETTCAFFKKNENETVNKLFYSDRSYDNMGIKVYSAAFTKDNDRIIASTGDSLYSFDMKTNTFTHGKYYNGFSYHKLSPSTDNNFMFLNLDTSFIEVLSSNHLLSSKRIVFDGLERISLLKISPDNKYVYISDLKNSVYRIKAEEIFKFEALIGTDNRVVRPGDTVHFKDVSLGYPDTFFWDFGDGSTSVEQNPDHVYKDPGYYDVKFIATRNDLKDTIIQKGYIHVLSDLECMEYTDFKYTNCVALKGYEEEDKTLVYHLRNDITPYLSYFAASKDSMHLWEKVFYNEEEKCLFRRSNGTYATFTSINNGLLVYNFDCKGNESDSVKLLQSYVLGFKAYKDNVTLLLNDFGPDKRPLA